MHNFEYNSQLPDLILKEYGRNIHKLVDYIVKIEDRDERTRFAHNLIELMRQINPNTRDSQDTQNKLWDDLYIMSHFSLDVESPFAMPEPDSIGKKPKHVGYNNHEISFRHYGYNVELLIARIYETEDPEQYYDGLMRVGKLMKSFYLTWNKDSVQDEVILAHLEKNWRAPFAPKPGKDWCERMRLSWPRKRKNRILRTKTKTKTTTIGKRIKRKNKSPLF
ncbi:MAG: DUF4290 domain-containing protein [Microscillaceae bacterium]|nr:DUF4290 domain-containing protein [Microscillaceae bacterium]